MAVPTMPTATGVPAINSAAVSTVTAAPRRCSSLSEIGLAGEKTSRMK